MLEAHLQLERFKCKEYIFNEKGIFSVRWKYLLHLK